MLRRALLLAAALTWAVPLAAQAPDSALYVRKGGGGGASSTLENALEKPHVVLHRQWNTVVYRDQSYPTSVVVLNSDATIEGTVRGDVVVINGSLNLAPTARISGRALAFGGNVYDADSAVVGGKREAFPAARFDTVRTTRGLALDYHGPPRPPYDLFVLPGLYGVTLPLYDRVDGLSLGWYPSLTLRDSALVVSPSVTYRSNLGIFDGALTLSTHVGGAFLKLTGARATLSNDTWIQTDFGNSFMVLCCGKDFRNYWRARSGEGRVGYRWTDTTTEVTLWAGARTETAWSVAAGGPWGITGTSSTYSMYRPNPAVEEGKIESGLAGVSAVFGDGDHAIHASAQAEVPFHTPSGARFTQLVADADGVVPLGYDQDLLFRAHLIYTSGDSAPPQRYGYLGGSGTLLTLGLLEQGGDQLLYLDGEYRYTFSGIDIPYTSFPSIALAYTAGSAGVGKLPSLVQNIGARVELKPLRFDAFVDPATGKWKTALLLWFVR